jgi:hypothetical protein
MRIYTMGAALLLTITPRAARCAHTTSGQGGHEHRVQRLPLLEQWRLQRPLTVPVTAGVPMNELDGGATDRRCLLDELQ